MPSLIQTASNNTTSSTSLAANFTSTPEVGNLLIAVQYVIGSTTLPSTPAGWLLLSQNWAIDHSDAHNTMSIFYKESNGSETGITVTHPTDIEQFLSLSEFRYDYGSRLAVGYDSGTSTDFSASLNFSGSNIPHLSFFAFGSNGAISNFDISGTLDYQLLPLVANQLQVGYKDNLSLFTDGYNFNVSKAGTANGFLVATAIDAELQFGLSYISPTSGCSYEPVTIYGSALTGVTSVTFDDIAAISFTVNSDDQITAIAPPKKNGYGVAEVEVVKGAESDSEEFVYGLGCNSGWYIA